MSFRFIARCLMLLLAAWLPLQSAATQWARASMPVAAYGPVMSRDALLPWYATTAEVHRREAGALTCHDTHEARASVEHTRSSGVAPDHLPSQDGSHSNGCPDCLACIGSGAAAAPMSALPILPVLTGTRAAARSVRFASLATIPPDPPPIA